MSIDLQRTSLTLPWCEVNAFTLIPTENIKPQWAIFTHGYTANKNDCLNWAVRLAESGVPVLIYDQPGHYLGSFNDVTSLDEFKNHFHELMYEGFKKLSELVLTPCEGLILGGHSLGAMSALKAMELPAFKDQDKIAILVGMGLNLTAETHIFDTTFYQKTLSIRKQLVSPVISPEVIFPWIRDQKKDIKITGQRIHLIVGADDVVVGKGGMDYFKNILETLGNTVTSYEPGKMAHHEPQNASPHVYAFLKSHYGWK
jgi:hypothetical protein